MIDEEPQVNESISGSEVSLSYYFNPPAGPGLKSVFITYSPSNQRNRIDAVNHIVHPDIESAGHYFMGGTISVSRSFDINVLFGQTKYITTGDLSYAQQYGNISGRFEW
jgi:hypothetical protein